ncbi:MAG: PQQ-binding-like beta-propeller repeat protein [Phycisphaerales bacterium]
MKKFLIADVIPMTFAITGVLVLMHLWLSADAAVSLNERLPGGDNKPANAGAGDELVKITGTLTPSDGVPAHLPGAWPRFRGPNYDAISPEKVSLSRSWPAEGPRVLWSVDVGEGYAGAAVLQGRVYVIDYDQANQSDVIRCLSLNNGKEIWRYSYPIRVKRFHGMSRTVPTVTDKYVVTMGPKGHVTCLDSKTGEFRWMLNLVKEYGTTIPQWYTAQCPLIDDGKAILAPAGSVLMLAVNCATGEVVWQTPNPDGWVMTHSSIMPMEFGGSRFYIYCGGSTDAGGVVGISAKDGQVLWKTNVWKVRTNVPMPVIVGEDRIFLSAGYGQYDYGCTMLRLTESEGRIAVTSEFVHPTSVFGTMQHTPIFYDNHIFGVGMDKQLACLDLQGNVVWTSTSANTFGSGPYAIADGLLYVLDDSGVLTVVEATSSGYNQLARAKVIDGVECWGPMAIASGRLIVRDLTRMICLDIAGQ